MENTTVTFTLENEKNLVHTKIEGSPSIDTILTLLFTGLLGILNNALETIKAGEPDVDEAEIRGHLYDMVNCGAAHVLDTFQPDPANKADELTAQAIMEAENKILELQTAVSTDE